MPGQNDKQSSDAEHSLDSAVELDSSDDLHSLTNSDLMGLHELMSAAELMSASSSEDEDRSAGDATHGEQQNAEKQHASTTYGEERTGCGCLCVGSFGSSAHTYEVGMVQWSSSSQIVSETGEARERLREWARGRIRAQLQEARLKLNQESLDPTEEPMPDQSRNALEGTIARLQADLEIFDRQSGEVLNGSNSTQVMCDNPIMCAGLADVPQCLRDWVESEAGLSGICRAWTRNNFAAVSIEELSKEQVLNGSQFVHLTHGTLKFKKELKAINGNDFLLCKLQGSTGAIVTFLIFDPSALTSIKDAPLRSTIGLCGLHTCPRKPNKKLAYCIKTGGWAKILKKNGRPKGSRNQKHAPPRSGLSVLPWITEAMKWPHKTIREAKKAASELRKRPEFATLPIHLKPTKRNIECVWGLKDTQTPPKKPKTGNAKKDNVDGHAAVVDSEIDMLDLGAGKDSEDSSADSGGHEESVGRSYASTVSHEERVRKAYANYLSNVWLPAEQKCLCPVYKDEKNMVFCIPSMQENSLTGAMIYNEQQPVFIHIGKLPDEQCAVVCSQCHPQTEGFWPKYRFEGIALEEPCPGFQERTADTEQLKPLCTHAWSLLSIPNRKGNSMPANRTNLWQVAETLRGPHEEWPVAEIRTPDSGVVNTTDNTFRQHPPGWLIQVGTIGSEGCGFVEMKTRGQKKKLVFHCKTCGGHGKCFHVWKIIKHLSDSSRGPLNVNGVHTSHSFLDVLDKYTTGEGPEGPDKLKLMVKSHKSIPDVPEEEVKRLLNLTAPESQVWYRLDERNQYSPQQERMMNLRSPGNLGSFPGKDNPKDAETTRGWVPSGGLRDRTVPVGDLKDPSFSDSATECIAGLFHVGGVVATTIHLPYDGNDDAVINVDNKYMFSWELVRKYLRELRSTQVNFSRFVKSMEETLVRCVQQCDELAKLFPVVLTTSSSSSDHLKSLKVAFSNAVHGYITLLDVDWAEMSRCRCTFENDKRVTLVYDNACNFLLFALNREPELLRHLSCHCDNFHHKYGSNGKGHVNCGPGTNVIHVGLHKKFSGNVIEQKNARVRPLEAIVSNECQPRMMNTFRYYHMQENKLEMVRTQHRKDQFNEMNDLRQVHPNAMFGVDAINLPQNGKHSFLCRPHENPPENCAVRWSNPVSSEARHMFPVEHRETLLNMSRLTSRNTFQEFIWGEEHEKFVKFLRTPERNPVLWMMRLECKDPHHRRKSERHGGQTEEFWSRKTPDELHKIKRGTHVRFSEECMKVRLVFWNWSSRNPEIQFLFPICSVALRTLLEKDTCTRQDLYAVRTTSGQHVRNILELDQNDLARVTCVPCSSNAQFSMSKECRALLTLILDIVDNSLNSEGKRCATRHAPPVNQIWKYRKSQSWLLTGEWFPHNPLRKTRTGEFVSGKRYAADERKDGSPKSLQEISQDNVCHKKVYTRNNLKPGLLTVHCMYCSVNVGFSFLDQPESVRTCFKLFRHRKMSRGDISDDEINDEEMSDDEANLEQMPPGTDDSVQGPVADWDGVSNAESSLSTDHELFESV